VRSIKLSLLAVLAATALLALPSVAAAKGPYKVNVHIQMSGGMKGPIYAWDPIMISLRGRGHGGERYDLCMTPGPLEHAPCYTNRRVNGPGISTEPSKGRQAPAALQAQHGQDPRRTLKIRKK